MENNKGKIWKLNRERKDEKHMSEIVNVYGKDEKGDMYLLKDNITEKEALCATNKYYKNTRRTVVIVKIN